MSVISNNKTFHQNHGDSPQVTPNNVVLSSLSINIHTRWNDPDQIYSPEICKSFSMNIHKRWSEPDQLTTPIITKTTSMGYYGWKYLKESITQITTKEAAKIRHHK